MRLIYATIKTNKFNNNKLYKDHMVQQFPLIAIIQILSLDNCPVYKVSLLNNKSSASRNNLDKSS